ncbi:patatin family protein [Roseibium sp. TrichSKD4]|uniref:patatin-like phospholipase family protein n=1 Tax=Roseibium sp. TrichSKD4 TaxID=744980 RepID=UPI0001E56439|nr:patatin-like phospholipase family protein [Roseibium sp. TrichSKD4]EFO33093.1 patatin family protein [Roseibium sp. TrichSKD4]
MAGKKRFVLSIDGGGVRGIIPLRILETIESRLAHRGVNKPMHELFDMMCGTSTGGLIAASLSAPKPDGKKSEAVATISELRDFYERDARTIFTPSISNRLARMIANPYGLFDESYDARPFEKLLKERFGWTSMASGLTNLVLTAYDIENRRALFMTNGLEEGSRRPDDYYFWQAVRATTAAPSYFEPSRVENLTLKREEALVDGGVFMNDPSIAAYLEARKLGWGCEDVVLLSLGTGYAPKRGYPYEQAVGWGTLGWMRPSNGVPLLSIFADGQSQTASYQAKWLFEEMNVGKYIRLTGEIPPDAEDFDNARPGNLITLNGAADRIIRDNTVVLDEFVEMLIANLPSSNGSQHASDLENAA